MLKVNFSNPGQQKISEPPQTYGEKAGESIQEGSIVDCVVKNVSANCVFVYIKCFKGRITFSNLSDAFILDVKKYFPPGAKLKALVIKKTISSQDEIYYDLCAKEGAIQGAINLHSSPMSLFSVNKWQGDGNMVVLKRDQIVSGRAFNMNDSGIFVRLESVGCDALFHYSSFPVKFSFNALNENLNCSLKLAGMYRFLETCYFEGDMPSFKINRIKKELVHGDDKEPEEDEKGFRKVKKSQRKQTKNFFKYKYGVCLNDGWLKERLEKDGQKEIVKDGERRYAEKKEEFGENKFFDLVRRFEEKFNRNKAADK